MSTPDMSKNTAATGGMTAAAPAVDPTLGQPQMPQGPLIGADEVPNLTDPTMRPNEPVTAGIPLGAGPGREALGPLPPSPSDPVRQIVEALMLTHPNPDLQRAAALLDAQGR